MTLLLEADRDAADNYQVALPGDVTVVDGVPAASQALSSRAERLVVVGPDIDLTAVLHLAESQRIERPEIGVVLVRRRVDVSVLARALRSGVREVVGADDLPALADACRRSLQVSGQLSGAAGGGPAEGRVTVVFSAKGGCGKTTTATNMAVALASGGQQSVCLVDLDLAFGDVAIALQLLPTRTIVDAVAMEGHVDEQGVRSIVTPHSPGLDTICAPLEPGQAERIPVSIVGELLRVLKTMYDHVVVDTPPAFTEHVLASFDAADRYVLLATLDIPALKNLRLTLDMLDLLGYPRDSWLVVLNRSDSKVGLSVQDVEKTLRSPIAAQIPSSRAVSASVNKGVPLVLDDPNHPVSVAIRDLADRGVRYAGARPEKAAAQRLPQRSRGFALLRRGRS